MADDDARARRPTKRETGASGKKAPSKKAPAKTGATKKAAPAGEPPVKKTAARKSAAATRKAPAKRAAATRKEPAASKAAAAKRPARKAGAVLAPRQKKAPPLRLAAEQTFADDLEPPAPPLRAEDPGARARAVLRAAAARIEGREETPPPPPPAPTPPRPSSDEPVTRVLVAPIPSDEPEEDVVEEVEVVEIVEDDEEDWSPPELLEAPEPLAAPPPPRPTPPPQPRPEPAPTVDTAPPPWEPPSPEDGKGGGGGERTGAGTSILAIVLALFVPLLGAIIGFVLANRGRRRGARLSGLARVVSILAFVGWLVGGGVVAYATLRDGGVDYSELEVGDCFDSSATNEVRGVKVKSCSEPHDSEIFFLVTHPAGPDEPYPGKDALVQFAADACLGQPLVDYLGVPLEQSELMDFEIVPQESAWEDGRRVLVCGLDTGGQGPITGSVKGTGR